MNPKLLRQYADILDEAAYQTGAQFMASRPPAAQPAGPAAGTAAATRAGQGSGAAKPTAPLPSNPTAPGYKVGPGGPAKIGTQNFNAPAKPTVLTSPTGSSGGAPMPSAKPPATNYNSAVKSANAAFAANQAKAPQGDQTAGGKTNASFLPGAAGGAAPAIASATAAPAASTTPAPQTNALGIAPQANIQGSPTGSAAEPTPAPQANALGISPQANASNPFGTTPASQAAKPTTPVGLGSAAVTPDMATASKPASVNPPTQGGPAVTGGFGQETNISSRAFEEDLDEADELSEIMRLSGQPMQEKAPPGAKAERMVKHIKKGYAKDGKLTDKEKGIAYATAWKAHNKDKVSESVMLEAGSTLEHIIKKFKHETKNFLAGNDLDNDLYDALYDYYSDNGEIPYGVAKARDGDPYQWVSNRFADEMQMHGYGRQADMLNMPGPDHELTELARLAGLSESQVAECGDMVTGGQEDSMNVSTNMSSDGTKNVSISAQGDKADALLQMLKMAGMRPHDDHDEGHEEVVVIGAPDEMMDEEYANSPDEEYETVSAITRQGNDLNREKRQYADQPKLGDNPMFEGEFEDEHDAVLAQEIFKGIQKAYGRQGFDWNSELNDVYGFQEFLGDVFGMQLDDTDPETVHDYFANLPGSRKRAVVKAVKQAVIKQFGDDDDDGYRGLGGRGGRTFEEVALDEELQDLLDSVLFREEMTDVLKAEQPYKDEKTGKMVTPPKGATMPPADSPPPAPKTNAPKVK